MVSSFLHGNLTHTLNLEIEGGVRKGRNASILISNRHTQNNNWSKEKEVNSTPIPSGHYWGKLFASHITKQSSIRSEV